MGCCGSSEVDETPSPRPQGQTQAGVPLANLTQGSDREDILQEDTRRAFLNVLHASFGSTPYLVIGGSALAEHGSKRTTKDVDVIIGGGLSKRSALDLLQEGSGGSLVKRAHGTMVYITPEGREYPLDISPDNDVDLPFDYTDAQRIHGVQIATLPFLLNSKARAWATRMHIEQNYTSKRLNDTLDISWCLRRIAERRVQVDRSRLTWVYTSAFWPGFVLANPNTEPLWRAAGLWTDERDFPSSGAGSSRSQFSSRVSSFGSAGG
ncbi:uncharacterized protein DNG_06628 [Cephalotrichum gorgonifer]|uniref:Uncharacterized protein n=1 Tax=Cephalotrichum gorgonifer TaxID=2041049 RepID=A0AAE8SWL4_9PEZI|nr:uncharacterized protein DNG_06628 [Cephalotrichum gorgonifer]